ncbi:MAG TPA: hypothetical protein DER09_13885 [Prolixibacteraceae bacterium]|nr:hypothetical protein [Prolixibacteraceae bacterium]
MKTLIVTVVFVVLSLVSLCDDFTYLRSWEGLPDGEINAIAQDSSGNMWLATWSGLIKYDGQQFVVYRPELGRKQSLPDKKIKSLIVDSENQLWITTSRYLCLYNAEKNTFQQMEFEHQTPGIMNILQVVEVNKMLVINTTNGLFTLPVDQKENKDYLCKKPVVLQNGTPLNDYYYKISFFNETLLLCKQYSGDPMRLSYSKLSKQNGAVEIHVEKDLFFPHRIQNISYVPADDRLFLGTSSGLISFQASNPETGQEIHFEKDNITQVYYASNHTLYITLSLPEIKYIDLHTGLTGSYKPNPNQTGSLLNNNVITVFEDFSGNLWFGHQGQGISILKLKRKEFKTFRKDINSSKSLSSNTVMCFEQSGDEFFIGCRTGGLNVIKKSELEAASPKFELIKWPVNTYQFEWTEQIWDIEKQSDSIFWVGTNLGLFKLEKKSGSWRVEPFRGSPAIDYNIRKIYIDKNGNIWCGTFSYGLLFIPDPRQNKSGKNFQFTSNPDDQTSLTDNTIISIFTDSKNRFWVGTENGLNQLEKNYDNLNLSGNEAPRLAFKRYVAQNSNCSYLNNNEINDITENYDGKIWISTQGGGINIFDVENNQWSHFTTKNGLPVNDIQGCLPDEDGNYWISTTNGLVKLSRFGEKPEITLFDIKDGIQGDIFMVNSFFKATDGQMFFGGDYGFTCFYPENIKSNSNAPKVSFTNLVIGDHVFEVGDTINKGFVLEKVLDSTTEIRLPFKDNTFKIGVSSVHFQDPTKNQISYYLEGYNQNWQTIPASNQFIEFVNLPFGDYVLHVKAISADNLLSATKKLQIEIEPPWYLAWYSVLVFVLLSMVMVTGFIFLLVHRQKLIYQRKLADLAARNNENKMQFLTNIAHDLRTPLSLIIAPIEDLKRNFTGNNPILDSHLNIISRNSNYLLRLINQIIDFQKSNTGKLTLVPERTDFNGLIRDIVMNFHGLESKSDVHIEVKTPDEPVFAVTDIQKVEEILYNLLSNAFKHTPAGESIEISLERVAVNNRIDENAKIVLSVFNHGPEIATEHLPLIFERFFKINEQAEGSGIGLSYTKSLVELLRGKIRAESVQGKGVIFTVELPVDYKDVEILQPVFEESTIEREKLESFERPEELTQREKRKVVIVEDNQELLDFLNNLFSRKYECYTAANGAEGLEIINREKPAIIVTDVVMPVMDGLELIREVKGNLETCHIPVILLTANNSDDARKSGYDIGADAYISKPFDIELLLTQSERLIKNRELIRDKYKAQNFMVEVDAHTSKDTDFVQNVKTLLEEHISNPEFNVNQLSQQLNISTTQLYRRLKQLTGYTPVEFIRLMRLQKAHGLLVNGKNTVKEVCYLTGFNNLSYFIKCFKEQFNITPASFRDHGTLNESDKQ